MATPLLRRGALALLLATSLAAPGAHAEDAVPQNDLLNATLWMQQSVEYKATTVSLYALARIRLDEALADKKWTAVPDLQKGDVATLPPAIVLDADETVLDNSPYEAGLITRGTGFSSKEWTDWVNARVTLAIPGAVDFLKYADSKGVKVFYVTNRTKEEEQGTLENMTALGFPMGGNVDTLLTKGEQKDWGSKKSTRIGYVAKDYRVMLLLGDNLGDFSDAYGTSVEERQKVFEANMAHWGKDWIALPNPSYGSWESAAFGHDYKKSTDQQRKEKVGQLKTWVPAK
jgi:acid phosphatase